MNNVLVVSNFSAGRKRAIKYRRKIQTLLLKKQTRFQFITIDELQEVDIETFDTILVVGGDGTVNKVLPYLVGTNKTLGIIPTRSEEHTSELQSPDHLVCRLLL